jgi:hypothetical protein
MPATVPATVGIQPNNNSRDGMAAETETPVTTRKPATAGIPAIAGTPATAGTPAAAEMPAAEGRLVTTEISVQGN